MKCKIIESPEQEARQEQCRKEVDRIIRETPRQISMEMYARAVAFEAYATGWNLRAELAQKEVEAAIAAERKSIVAAIEAKLISSSLPDAYEEGFDDGLAKAIEIVKGGDDATGRGQNKRDGVRATRLVLASDVR